MPQQREFHDERGNYVQMVGWLVDLNTCQIRGRLQMTHGLKGNVCSNPLLSAVEN